MYGQWTQCCRKQEGGHVLSPQLSLSPALRKMKCVQSIRGCQTDSLNYLGCSFSSIHSAIFIDYDWIVTVNID